MSLYNQLCGNHPLFWVLARIIESPKPLPTITRFRDIWTRESEGVAQVVIYTRTGGNNRDDEETKGMKEHPLFVATWNDTFDNTFAHFAFNVPTRVQERMLRFHRLMSRHPKGMSPKEKFDRAMARLQRNRVDDPGLSEEEMHEVIEIAKDMLTDVRDSPSTIEITMRHHMSFKVHD